MQPYYTVMRLPGEKQTEFIQMLPFTPRSKDNLSAWMVARSDPAHYGQMRVYQFPKQKIIYGPRQIAGKINQDPQISQRITLWNQQGSEVVWGTLLVIPIEESLLYVRPLYLRSSTAKIPELKNVVIVTANQIVMAETLRQALIQIFGQSVSSLPPDRLQSSATSVVPSAEEPPIGEQPTAPEPTINELVQQAKTHMERADKALRDGDLATYGEEMKKAKDLIDTAAKIKK
jgi:uncharacterized membrane protein (UPF0182 family)